MPGPSDSSGNLFSHLPDDLPEELTETLSESGSVRIERIISRGHRSPDDFWYDQAEDEWVILLQGRATLRFEEDNRSMQLLPGDWVNIPAHQRHRVDDTSADETSIWLAVFSPAG